jgi:hypothetical protein
MLLANVRLATAEQGLLGKVLLFVFSFFSFLSAYFESLGLHGRLQACYQQANNFFVS